MVAYFILAAVESAGSCCPFAISEKMKSQNVGSFIIFFASALFCLLTGFPAMSVVLDAGYFLNLFNDIHCILE